jgi:hypothetical protein
MVATPIVVSRHFVRGKAQAFCSSFMKSPATCTDGLPSYATQCTGSTLARVSSACSCLNSNTFTSQQAFSTPANVKTHSSQPAFSTSVSVNTFTSQPAFSSPTGSRTTTAFVSVASSAGLISHSIASSAPAQVFSFTTVFTNSQGSLVTSVIQATLSPSFATSSSKSVQSTASASAQPSSPRSFSFTSTGTNAQGNPFTTVTQGTFTPSGVALPFTSTEIGTNSKGSTVTSLLTGFGFPFTSTVTGTDARGFPFTSLFTGIAPAPGGSFPGFPLPTGRLPTSAFLLAFLRSLQVQFARRFPAASSQLLPASQRPVHLFRFA